MRYIALVWNPYRSNDSAQLRDVRAALGEKVDWSLAIDLPGLLLFHTLSSSAIGIQYLANRAGAVIGTLFTERPNGEYSYVDKLDGRVSQSVTDTRGRTLVSEFWGRYVAFIHLTQTREVLVLRDPTGGVNCLTTDIRGVRLYFSDVNDLLPLKVTSLSVNWPFIAAHMIMAPRHSEQTAVTGIRELLGGHCDVCHDGEFRTERVWDPSTIASTDIRENFRATVNEVRKITQQCINAWAGRNRRVLHLLSGGIDSSVALACLKRVPTPLEVTCLTLFNEGLLGGDERPYAKLAVDHAGCAWITQSFNLQGSLAVAFQIVKTVRPTHYLPCINEREMVEQAISLGAEAIYNGDLGDSLFYESRAHGATDYLWNHGIDIGLLYAIKNAAAVQKMTFWSVMRDAFRSRSRNHGAWKQTAYSPDVQLLTEKAAGLGTEYWSSLESPWLRDVSRIPPGKRAHIRLLACSVAPDMPLRRPGDPEPLVIFGAQPLIELCLKIPTYILTAGKRPRAVVRDAFVNQVPDVILRRVDKGNASRVTAIIMKNNIKLVRRYLEDGILVNQGYLDPDALRAALSGPSHTTPTSVLGLFSTEAWLRGWLDPSLTEHPPALPSSAN